MLKDCWSISLSEQTDPARGIQKNELKGGIWVDE